MGAPSIQHAEVLDSEEAPSGAKLVPELRGLSSGVVVAPPPSRERGVGRLVDEMFSVAQNPSLPPSLWSVARVHGDPSVSTGTAL